MHANGAIRIKKTPRKHAIRRKSFSVIPFRKIVTKKEQQQKRTTGTAVTALANSCRFAAHTRIQKSASATRNHFLSRILSFNRICPNAPESYKSDLLYTIPPFQYNQASESAFFAEPPVFLYTFPLESYNKMSVVGGSDEWHFAISGSMMIRF